MTGSSRGGSDVRALAAGGRGNVADGVEALEKRSASNFVVRRECERSENYGRLRKRLWRQRMRVRTRCDELHD